MLSQMGFDFRPSKNDSLVREPVKWNGLGRNPPIDAPHPATKATCNLPACNEHLQIRPGIRAQID